MIKILAAYNVYTHVSAVDVTVNMSMTTSFPGVLLSQGGVSEYTHDVAQGTLQQ